MLKVNRLTLGSSKARKLHEQIVSHNNCYSLTITLNPWFNTLSMCDQFDRTQKEIIAFFKEMAPYFKESMASPEFTEDYNIHYHCYIVANNDELAFIQNVKHHIVKHKVFGKVWKLKKVDEVTNNLKGYPFKDIERTTSYSEALGYRFNPKHLYFTPMGNIIINTNNDNKVVHNGKTYKFACIKDYIDNMKEQINNLEKII